MTDVFDRVEAIPATVTLWPDEPFPDSGFANDLTLSPHISPYTVARTQLLTSMRRLRDAARLAQEDDGWGTHLLMLRPTLVLAAKAAWIVRPEGSNVSTTLENEAIATVENEATQTDWMGDLYGGLGFDPATGGGRCSAALGRPGLGRWTVDRGAGVGG